MYVYLTRALLDSSPEAELPTHPAARAVASGSALPSFPERRNGFCSSPSRPLAPRCSVLLRVAGFLTTLLHVLSARTEAAQRFETFLWRPLDAPASRAYPHGVIDETPPKAATPAMELSDTSSRCALRVSANSRARRLALLAECAFGATRCARHDSSDFYMDNSPAAVGGRVSIDLFNLVTSKPA